MTNTITLDTEVVLTTYEGGRTKRMTVRDAIIDGAEHYLAFFHDQSVVQDGIFTKPINVSFRVNRDGKGGYDGGFRKGDILTITRFTTVGDGADDAKENGVNWGSYRGAKRPKLVAFDGSVQTWRNLAINSQRGFSLAYKEAIGMGVNEPCENMVHEALNDDDRDTWLSHFEGNPAEALNYFPCEWHVATAADFEDEAAKIEALYRDHGRGLPTAKRKEIEDLRIRAMTLEAA